MISFDSNLLIYALNSAAPEQPRARAFFEGLQDATSEIVVCELVLMEVYSALRNPVIFEKPCDAVTAVELLRPFRRHPRWRLVDYPGLSSVTDAWWRWAADPAATRRRVYDARLALTLRHHGVTRFATRNCADFEGFGFERVWNPLEQS